jgi:hypothetical protein
MSGIAGGMMLANYKPIVAAPAGDTDPYLSDVQLLLNGGGSDGSTTIVDSSANNWSFTNTGSVAYSTTQTKFASTSIYFNGSRNLVLATATNLQMPGDFTWEAWVYATTTAGFYGIIGTSAIYGRILISNNAGLYWESDNGSAPLAVSSGYPPTGAWTANAWQHVALTRSGSSWRFFKNGTQIGSTQTASFTPETTQNLNIGSTYGSSNRFTGYLEGVRFTKGVARYTANFTAPTAAFPTS